MACDPRSYPALVDRLFIGDLPRRQRRGLRRHLALCRSCRAYYDKLALLSRAFVPGGMGLDTPDPDESPLRRFSLLAAAFAAAGLLALVALVALRARSEGREPAAAAVEGFRLYCLSAPPRPEVRAAARGGPFDRPPTVRCALGESIQFAYSRSAPGPRHLLVIGRDAGGHPLSYTPGPGAPPSFSLAAGAVDEPLAATTRVALHHRPGTVDVLALFSDRPIAPAKVESALAEGLDRAAALADNVERIRLEVVP
jgi:hypothetical protein